MTSELVEPTGPDGAAEADGPDPRRTAERAIAATRRVRRRARCLWTGVAIITVAIVAVVVAMALAHRTHVDAPTALLVPPAGPGLNG